MSSWIKNVVDRIKDLNGSVDSYRKDSIIQSIPTVAYVNKAKKLIENKKYDEAEVVLSVFLANALKSQLKVTTTASTQ